MCVSEFLNFVEKLRSWGIAMALDDAKAAYPAKCFFAPAELSATSER
jgi:hypothetical protein